MAFKSWPRKAVSTCCDLACCAYGEQSALPVRQKTTPLMCQAFLTAQQEKEPFPTCIIFFTLNNLHIFCLFLPFYSVNLVCQVCWLDARLYVVVTMYTDIVILNAGI